MKDYNPNAKGNRSGRDLFGSSDSGAAPTGRDPLFKNGRRHSSLSEAQDAGAYNQVETDRKRDVDESSEVSIEVPLEEPEPEVSTKRKIIRVTKPVKLRDFTQKEKGEEENEIEKLNEIKDEKENQKPRGWLKTDNDDGTFYIGFIRSRHFGETFFRQNIF